MTFISIIIPFKKGKRYLIDCLDSLVEQNLSDEEIIIIANGIQENGIIDLIDDYGEKLNIQLQVFDEEIGAAKARNEGLKLASGQYVYFIDSDDYLYSDALSKLIDAAKKTGADFINGERINTYFIKHRFEEQLLETTPLKQNGLTDEEFSFKLLVGHHTRSMEVLSVLHALIKKDAIADTLFDEDNRYFTDYDFIVDIFDNVRSFCGVENSLYAKRESDDPINLISLNQEEKGDKFLLYCSEYEKVYNRISPLKEKKYELLIDEMLDKFYRHYYNYFAVDYARNPDEKWRTTYFDALHDILIDFNLSKLSGLRKMEMKAFQERNAKKLKSIIQLRFISHRIKEMATNYELFKQLVYLNVFNKRKLNENQIFIESFRGDFYSDNPKYI
jgi:CDP-glycerol glycerophosphotransferase